MKVRYVADVEILDPDTNLPIELCIFKEEAGGMFAVDASYYAQEIDNIHSPFGNGLIEEPDEDLLIFTGMDMTRVRYYKETKKKK